MSRVANRELPGRIVLKAGGPSKLTERLKHYSAHLITSGAKQNAVVVEKALREEHGISVHVNTVRNALRDMGLGAIRKPKKSLLRNKNVKNQSTSSLWGSQANRGKLSYTEAYIFSDCNNI